MEESGRELGLGTALICDEAACWISGWETLILLSMGESVCSSKKTIFAWEDFLLFRESLQATKKFFFFFFFFFPFRLPLPLQLPFCLCLLLLSFFCPFPSLLASFFPCAFSPGISCGGCTEILRQGKCIYGLRNHFCQKD